MAQQQGWHDDASHGTDATGDMTEWSFTLYDDNDDAASAQEFQADWSNDVSLLSFESASSMDDSFSLDDASIAQDYQSDWNDRKNNANKDDDCSVVDSAFDSAMKPSKLGTDDDECRVHNIPSVAEIFRLASLSQPPASDLPFPNLPGSNARLGFQASSFLNPVSSINDALKQPTTSRHDQVPSIIHVVSSDSNVNEDDCEDAPIIYIDVPSSDSDDCEEDHEEDNQNDLDFSGGLWLVESIPMEELRFWKGCEEYHFALELERQKVRKEVEAKKLRYYKQQLRALGEVDVIRMLPSGVSCRDASRWHSTSTWETIEESARRNLNFRIQRRARELARFRDARRRWRRMEQEEQEQFERLRLAHVEEERLAEHRRRVDQAEQEQYERSRLIREEERRESRIRMEQAARRIERQRAEFRRIEEESTIANRSIAQRRDSLERICEQMEALCG